MTIKEDYFKMEKKVFDEDYNKVKHCLLWPLKFGKHKGKTYIDIIILEHDYFQWLVDKNAVHEKVLEAYNLLKMKLN